MTRLLITLCTYNEEQNIRLLIPELRAVVPGADILVIDDNSPDGTGAVVEAMAADDQQVKLLSRPRKPVLALRLWRVFGTELNTATTSC